MTEIKREVKTYEVQKFCPSCNDGIMESTGRASSNNFTTYYYHMCKLCHHLETYEKYYPTIEYEYI